MVMTAVLRASAKCLSQQPHPEEGRMSVRRFDQRLQYGIQAMKSVMGRIGEGHMSRPWVYPRADHLVLSDDYFALACLEMLKMETVRVWHLGVPAGGLHAHGPTNDKVRQLISADTDTVKL
jgi:hypothetical protein